MAKDAGAVSPWKGRQRVREARGRGERAVEEPVDRAIGGEQYRGRGAGFEEGQGGASAAGEGRRV